MSSVISVKICGNAFVEVPFLGQDYFSIVKKHHRILVLSGRLNIVMTDESYYSSGLSTVELSGVQINFWI